MVDVGDAVGIMNDLALGGGGVRRTGVADDAVAVAWLMDNGYTRCYKVLDPEISKTEVKKLLTAGKDVPGVALVQDLSCSLR